MLTRKPTWLATLAIVSLLAILVSRLVSHHVQSDPLPRGDKKSVANANDRGSQSNHHVATTSPEVPLPAENAPLADTFKDLVRSSNAGSAAASMRLLRDLRKCGLRQASQSMLDSVYYHHPGQTDADYARQISPQEIERETYLKEALDRLESTDNLCRGIDDQTVESSGEFLRQAALQNDLEAKVCYASSYELGPPYLSTAWFDYAARWQREAPYIAQQALDAGEPGILVPLIDAYMPDDPDTLKIYSLHEVIAPDTQMAYTLYLLYVRLAQGADLQQGQKNLAALSSKLQANQLKEAQDLADALWPRFQHASAAGTSLTPCPEFLSFRTDTIIIEAPAAQ